MGPKTNSKAVAGRARKAEQEEKKKAAATAAAEATESTKWEQGAKGRSTKESKAEKAAQLAARKAENARLLAEEEVSLPSKPKNKGGAGKAGAGTSKGGGAGKSPASSKVGGIDSALDAFSASNIDDALDALTLATEKTDNATMGSKAAAIDRHPERRFKAAFEAFKERELPRVKQDHPGLRMNQMQDLLYKEFQSHPDNPFNQITVAYNATKEEKVEALKAQRAKMEERLRS